MNTVAANVQQLEGWNRSMAGALERAANGSDAEDMYFIEKLEKTANAIGFELKAVPGTEQASSENVRVILSGDEDAEVQHLE